MKHSKRYTELHNKIETGVEFELDEAITRIKGLANAKFDETVEISLNLGVDPRHADQMIRSTVSLPHGIGKVVRVLVLCKEDRVQEALDAGADYAGLDEYVDKIKGGWMEIDSCLATPDVMPQVGKIGRILGPRGLMPNPKTGTITRDITASVKEIKAGRLAFRVDKFGIMHIPVGKASFEQDKLKDNIKEFLITIQRLRPSAAKGQYFKRITLASTMGPGVRVSRVSAMTAIR
ncbi:MAG: 50S ribosomal protein L1 [Candidatus Hatepunaea meridiana]|nr:50S ribosomal protein L1 [Candidatus Hatepunaea meridiana]